MSYRTIVDEILAGEPLCNFSHAFYDGFVEANVNLRQRAGVQEQVIRRQLGKCCDWCANLVGIYDYGNHPKDVFKRHDNCRCMVTFKSATGKYKDVWSKEEFETQREARIMFEKRGKVAVASPIYVNKSDMLFTNAKKIKPLPNFVDVVCHSDEYGFAFRDKNDNEATISAFEFCKILEHDPNYTGGNIRLIACRAGAGGNPQFMADYFGVDVLAPSEDVVVDSNGKMVVANDMRDAILERETGKWILFKGTKK